MVLWRYSYIYCLIVLVYLEKCQENKSLIKKSLYSYFIYAQDENSWRAQKYIKNI